MSIDCVKRYKMCFICWRNSVRPEYDNSKWLWTWFLINRNISTPTIFDYISLICAVYAILRYMITEEIKLVSSDDNCVCSFNYHDFEIACLVYFSLAKIILKIVQTLNDLDMYVANVSNHMEGWSIGFSLYETFWTSLFFYFVNKTKKKKQKTNIRCQRDKNKNLLWKITATFSRRRRLS